MDLVSLEPGPVPENAEGSDPLAGPIQLVGRTDCDRIVVFNGNPRLAGSLASISVEEAGSCAKLFLTQKQPA